MGTWVAEIGTQGAETFVEKARTGFDADLCGFHGELLRYLSSRVNDRDAAADLVQETCIRALRYREELSGTSLRSMLYRIANNLVTDYWRRAQTHHTAEHVSLLESEPIAVNMPLPEEVLEQQQRLAALKHAVMALPPKRRRVFIMARLQGKSHSEIAHACGISISAVEKHLARAIVACSARVGKQDL